MGTAKAHAPATDDARASEWRWVDLDATGPEAESARLEAQRSMQEVEAAYGRGFADGEEAGVRTARDELQVAVGAAVAALEEIRANREAWEARLHERMVMLAAAMAQKIVGRACVEDPEAVIELARKAVAKFPVGEGVRIRLHPSDHAVFLDERYFEGFVGDRTVRWIPDEDVVPGGCVVEGPDRIVDGRVDEALCRIVRALTDG